MGQTCRWLSCKEFACQCRRLWLDPWVRRMPWRRRKWQPTPVFLPGKSMTRGTCQTTVRGVAKIRTRLSTCVYTHTHTHTHTPVYLKQHSRRRIHPYCNHYLGSFDSPTTFYWLFATKSFFQSHLVLVWNLEAVGFIAAHCCKY